MVSCCCCRASAKYWIYPATVNQRAYQVDIIKTALLQNTLVCLPTGLGKTLIAAVIMHNFTRWFPEVCPGSGAASRHSWNFSIHDSYSRTGSLCITRHLKEPQHTLPNILAVLMYVAVQRNACHTLDVDVQGKVVFVAPTKPLVNQQIQACYEFMGVSKV